MDYILHYTGKVPKHVNVCIDSIKKIDPDSNIIFLNTTDFQNENALSINCRDISDQYLESLDTINYFSEEKNKLWETSLSRIFLIHNAAKQLKIDKFIHFDTDVLIYKPYESLKFCFKENKLNITPADENRLVFGYSFIEGINNLTIICEKIINLLKNVKQYEDTYSFGNKLNEMIILNIIYIENPNLFNLLDTIPKLNNEIIFDGMSYGQYLGGVDKKVLSKYYLNRAHYAGRAMLDKGFRPKLSNQKPYIIYEDKIFEIANLHIHKKNLRKFAP